MFQWHIYSTKHRLESPSHEYKHTCRNKKKKRVADLISSIIKWGLIRVTFLQREVWPQSCSLSLQRHNEPHNTTHFPSPCQRSTTIGKFLRMLALWGAKSLIGLIHRGNYVIPFGSANMSGRRDMNKACCLTLHTITTAAAMSYNKPIPKVR